MKFLRHLVLGVMAALLLAGSGAAAAVPHADYREAQYVQVLLGDPNQELGIQLVDGQPDGITGPVPSGRISQANAVRAERYFYFDVHDSYMSGGKNEVVMTVTYKDVGLTPVWLEYDAYDPYRPQSLAEEVARKRVTLFDRSNSEAMRTARVTLTDARFQNSQPGGADFRIGSTDDLVLANVSVMRIAHEEPAQPVRVLLDGQPVAFDPNDVQPFIHPTTGRTLVPMRALFRALGVQDSQIGWDARERRVDVQKGLTLITLYIDSDVALVNGKPVRLDQAAAIVGGRTVVPVRFVAEQFGLKVEWDPAQQLVTLTTRLLAPLQPPPPPGSEQSKEPQPEQ